MSAAAFLIKSRRALGSVSSLYKATSIKVGSSNTSFAAFNNSRNILLSNGNASRLLQLRNSLTRNPAVTYGYLAGTSLFAVYGLTGGFKSTYSPKLNVGYDHYPSNNPCEDRIIVETPIPNLLVAGVADGHGGTFVSDIIKIEFGNLVKKLFSDIQSIADDKVNEYMSKQSVSLYHDLDDVVYDMVMSMWMSDSSVLTTGACLVSTFIFGNHCLIANAGDCRAVLGRSSRADGAVKAVPLTHDHNIREPAELQKLRAAHPSSASMCQLPTEERDLVKYYNGEPVYVKGLLQPTRCIGDFVLKRKEFIESIPLLHRFAASFSPPYIEATPEVNVFDIGANDEFIVMASDGVWDELDNQVVVDIVSEVLKKGNSVDVAANTVVESCLTHAAKRNELTVKQLKGLQVGQRRRFHDDMSVIVVKLHPES